MNKLTGQISSIQVYEGISLVAIQISDDETIKSIILETPESADYLVLGRKINVIFKETEVIIGLRRDYQISIQNRLPGVIQHIDNGKLISEIRILIKSGSEVNAIISSESARHMRLSEGLEVFIFIKINEIMLST